MLRIAIAIGLPTMEVARAIAIIAHSITAMMVCGWVHHTTRRSSIAILAGLGTALLPPVASLAGRVQPDALVALWLVITTIAAARWVHRPRPLTANPSSLGLLLGLLAVGVLLRIHGLIVALMLVAVIGVGGGRLFRLGRMLLALAALHLAPLAVGLRPDWIWAHPWTARLFHTLTDSSDGGSGMPEEIGRAISEKQLSDPDWIDRPLWALQQAPDCWAWVLAGAVSVGLLVHRDRRKLVLILPFLPLVPAMFSWAEPRHVAVVTPVALALWARGLAIGGISRWALSLLGVFALVATIGQASFHWERLSAESRMNASHRAFGAALCAVAQPGDLSTGVRASFLYCPLPVHLPDGSDADWKTWAVGRRPLGPGWERVELAGRRVYRVAPALEGAERPCADHPPDPTTPFFGAPDRPTTLLEPCRAPDRSWKIPDPAQAAHSPSDLERRRRRPGSGQ